MADKKYTYTIGRRKTASATLRLFEEKGANVVNEKSIAEYFPKANYEYKINNVFEVAGLKKEDFYYTVRVSGSGHSAQAEAVRHALARAIVKVSPETKDAIKKAGYLTRDSRMVERKKPGLRKARKAEQFSKR
ncbi:MAG: 30S ribosomal protein S9 [Candidatus Dojkabacteria bacterium]|nr:30S ribosomal protein S9 [Candidatus Dojkabacteria bacterium]MDQ7021830.1 30S ribosomal protein S9 [Candidatus Dojkabacteria bacterium]